MEQKKPIQLLLTEKTLRMTDGNLRTFPNYDKDLKALKEIKHWRPAKNELMKMKKALDKLTPKYDDAKNFGQKITAKRIFKKAMQISKRLSVLLGGVR